MDDPHAYSLHRHGSVDLSTDEKVRVLAVLPPGTSLEAMDTILSILSHVHTGGGSSEEDISDQDQVGPALLSGGND